MFVCFQVKILKTNGKRVFGELGKNIVEELDHGILPG